MTMPPSATASAFISPETAGASPASTAAKRFSQRRPAIRRTVCFSISKCPAFSGRDVSPPRPRPPFPVIMISAHGDVSVAVQAIKLGATDFVEKPFAPEALDEAIEEAIAATRGADDRRPAAGGRLDALTQREREIALALNEGLSNKEIARDLDISPRTVEVHRARVFEKLGVRNVAGLVRFLADV